MKTILLNDHSMRHINTGPSMTSISSISHAGTNDSMAQHIL